MSSERLSLRTPSTCAEPHAAACAHGQQMQPGCQVEAHLYSATGCGETPNHVTQPVLNVATGPWSTAAQRWSYLLTHLLTRLHLRSWPGRCTCFSAPDRSRQHAGVPSHLLKCVGAGQGGRSAFTSWATGSKHIANCHHRAGCGRCLLKCLRSLLRGWRVGRRRRGETEHPTRGRMRRETAFQTDKMKTQPGRCEGGTEGLTGGDNTCSSNGWVGVRGRSVCVSESGGTCTCSTLP